MAPPVCYPGYLLEQCSISHFQEAKGPHAAYAYVYYWPAVNYY